MTSEFEWLSEMLLSLLGDGRLDRPMSASASSRKGSDLFWFLPWWRGRCDGKRRDADVELTAGGWMDASMAAGDGAN